MTQMSHFFTSLITNTLILCMMTLHTMITIVNELAMNQFGDKPTNEQFDNKLIRETIC